jgi:hypothetical protein
LRKQGLLQTLQPAPGDRLSRQQLQQLVILTMHPEKVKMFDYSQLDALIADILIATEEDQSKAWWNSFLSWLKSFKSEQYENEFQWLVKFLESMSLSEQAVNFILYSLLILLTLTALGLVVYECYITGVFFRSGRKRRVTQVVAMSGEISAANKALKEIKMLDSSAQMAALFAYVIRSLTFQGNLPEDDSMTNQELSTYMQRHGAHYKNNFAQLVSIVDPVVYGNIVPTPDSLWTCWQQTERILADE